MDEVETAVESKDRAGWLQFVCSRMVKPWKDVKESWLTHTASRWKKSSNKWFVEFNLAVLEILWSVWENRNNWLHDPSHPWKPQNVENFIFLVQQEHERHEPDQLSPRDRKHVRRKGEEKSIQLMMTANNAGWKQWNWHRDALMMNNINRKIQGF